MHAAPHNQPCSRATGPAQLRCCTRSMPGVPCVHAPQGLCALPCGWLARRRACPARPLGAGCPSLRSWPSGWWVVCAARCVACAHWAVLPWCVVGWPHSTALCGRGSVCVVRSLRPATCSCTRSCTRAHAGALGGQHVLHHAGHHGWGKGAQLCVPAMLCSTLRSVVAIK